MGKKNLVKESQYVRHNAVINKPHDKGYDAEEVPKVDVMLKRELEGPNQSYDWTDSFVSS